jgi:branched-chain amino acid transport system substrate-binding protein
MKTISQYTGVPSGKANGAPLRIGFVNTEGARGASQELTIAVEEAIRTVNEYLGGIKGRPIELKKCLPADVAQATQCAKTFVDDPAVVAVMQGTLDVDMSGFHATLGPKIPVMGSLPLSLADATATNAYYLSSGQFGALGAVSYARDYAKAKKVSVLGAGGFASTELAMNTLKVALEAIDVQVTLARFPFDATDFTPFIAASKAAEADLLIPAISSPQQCVGVNNALQQLGINTPVLTFTGCLGLDVRKALGDYPRWNYMAFSVSAEASATDDLTAWQVRAFNEWFPPLEARGVTRNGGVEAFQFVLTLVKTLAATPGDAPTAASASAQMKKFTGPVILGVPRLTYGAIPGMPAIGSLASRVYVYLGNDSWRDSTAGQWIEPPAQTQQPRR